MPSALRVVLPCVLVSVGCADDVPVEVPVGPLTFAVDVASIAVPASLRNQGSIASVPCSASVPCPMTAPFTLRCVGGVCDPDPVPIELGVMDPIDLGAWSSALATVGTNVRQITVARAQWQAVAMGLRTPVGPIELYWGPESASGIAADGVRRLGTVPTLAFDATGNAGGDVDLDAAGNRALSEYFLRVSRRFRVFARTVVELTPGAPLPAGRASIQLRFVVRAETRLLP